jgi:hypothetical protein
MLGTNDRSRLRQPFRGVVAVVRLLPRFDRVEEDLVDQGLARAGDRGKKRSGPIGIGAWDRRQPGDPPLAAYPIDGVRRDPSEKRRHVEHRVPDPAIAPVEEDQRTRLTSDVAGVEVTVDDRVRETARLDRGEAPWQVRDERLELAAVVDCELVAATLDKCGQRGRQRRATPVGQADVKQLVRSAGPRSLERNQS